MAKKIEVLESNSWDQLMQMDLPASSPIETTTVAVAPVQSWRETEQVLPDIGDVDYKIIAAAGNTNTILVSAPTAEVLKSITVSIGTNGHWYIGNTDTGVAAKGTEIEAVARPTGVYKGVTIARVGDEITIAAGLEYSVLTAEGYKNLVTSAPIKFTTSLDAVAVTLDGSGVLHTYPKSIALSAIPPSEALVAVSGAISGDTSAAGVWTIPTIHNAWVIASASAAMAEAIQRAATDALGYAQTTHDLYVSVQQMEAGLKSTLSDVETKLATLSSDAQNLESKFQTVNSALVNINTSKSEATTAAAEAAASARAAAASATTASAASTTASASATSATGSKQAATSSATAAATAEALAAKYANALKGVEVETGRYSAYHWALIAQEAAATLTSGVVYRGGWSAAAGTAPPSPGAHDPTPYYRITVAGTIVGITLAAGDLLYWDGTSSWYRVPGNPGVTSVNGHTGDLTLHAADVGALPAAGMRVASEYVDPLTLSGASPTLCFQENLTGNTYKKYYIIVDGSGFRIEEDSNTGDVMLAYDAATNLLTTAGGASIYTSTHKPTPAELGAATAGHTHGNATNASSGLMTAAEHVKLADIAVGANNYVHPTGDGNWHIPAVGTANVGRFIKATSAGHAGWADVTKADVGLDHVPNKLFEAFSPTKDTVVVRDQYGQAVFTTAIITTPDSDTIAGGLVFRQDSDTHPHLRVCNSPAAVRAWLGIPEWSVNNVAGTLVQRDKAGEFEANDVYIKKTV